MFRFKNDELQKNTIATPVGWTATKSEFRIFVYCVVVSSLAMTWRLVPKWVWHPQQFFRRFGGGGEPKGSMEGMEGALFFLTWRFLKSLDFQELA